MKVKNKMVIEVKDIKKVNEYIVKYRLTLVALISKYANKSYVMKLLKTLEEESLPTIYTVLVVDDTSNDKRSAYNIMLNLYLDGVCIFSQEGVFNNLENDLTVLKRGIREVLRSRSIQIRFVKR